MKTVNFTVELTTTEALSFAQFLKRSNFSDYRSHATSDDEAYRMLAAEAKIREALAEAGYAPR